MDYNKIQKQYSKVSLWITAALYLVGLLVAQLTEHAAYISMLTISVCFSVLAASVYGGAWKAIASRSPAVLGKFYLAGSLLRMLLAFLVILVYALVTKDRKAVISFAAVFMVFYLVLLAFDAIYFSKVEKNNKPITDK